MTTRLPIVLAITGASGALYAVRLLRELIRSGQPVWLIVSAHGWRLLETEAGIGSMSDLQEHTEGDWEHLVTVFDDGDRGARPASGSARSLGMVVCPCSMGTLAAIALGTSRSLVERAADVTLKERRKLVLVPRETPYSRVHLENMLRVTEAGAVVLPASPGFYNDPKSIDDLIGFVVGRVLDQIGVENEVAGRWGEAK
jgi:flavin prenyltransferase